MYKVIIADDEAKVCQLILELIDWNALGFEISAIAKNGHEAYSLICEHMPDIVITDIRMPGYDGIELVKLIHAKGTCPYFIILSGYSHFEYAREALRYGVENYLLKPVNKNELIETLSSIKEKLINEKARIEQTDLIKSQLNISKDKMHQLLINNIKKGGSDYQGLKIDQLNEYYQLNFKEGHFQVVHIKLDNYSESVINLETIFGKFKDIINSVLRDECFEIICDYSISKKTLILNYDKSKKNTINNLIRDTLFKKLLSYVEVFNSFNLSIGIGTPKNSFMDIYQSFTDAKNAVNCRFCLGVNRVIEFEALNYIHIPISNIISVNKKQQLANIIEVLDISGFEQWIKDIYSSLHLFENYYPSIQYEIADEIKSLSLHALLDLGIEWENYKVMQEQIYDLLDSSINESQLVKKLISLITKQMDNLLHEKKMQDNRPIRLAKQYISENYSKSISLEQVAEIVHLNASYLSVIFKKETGMNFIDYLINYRINISKDLLKNSDLDLNLSEIAEKVGYIDSKYFSKLFYKVIGIKPSEYRKIFS
jgi:Response regulator containing CheY-like receiver domain and AraC-type DNA-binding domain